MDFQTAAWHIARRHRHGLSQVRLLKLLWLAELTHYERTGMRLTDTNWFRYEHGPFTKELYPAVHDEGVWFSVEEDETPDGYRTRTVRSIGQEPPGDAAEDELKDLEDTLWLYEKYTTRELLAEVYEDPFFEDTPHSSDFDFSRLPDLREIDIPAEKLEALLNDPKKARLNIAELLHG